MTKSMTYQDAYENEKLQVLSKMEEQHEEIMESIRLKNVKRLNEGLKKLGYIFGREGQENLSNTVFHQFVQQLVPIKGVEVKDKSLSATRYPIYIDGELAGTLNLRTEFLEPTSLDKKKKKIEDLEMILRQCESDIEKHKEVLHQISTELSLEKDDGSLFYSKLVVKKTQTENAYNRCVSRFEEVKRDFINRKELMKDMMDKQERINAFADKYGFTVIHISQPMK